MNYGERLASWYLRLNGFFPMPDFVLHRLTRPGVLYDSDAHNADVDLLAVRFPYVFEEVGGQQDDWDAELLGPLLDEKRPSALIVEVKTGALGRPPDQQRLERSLRRIGLFPETSVPAVAKALMPEPDRGKTQGPAPGVVTRGKGVVGTLLVCPGRTLDRARARYTHVISLEHCEKFIQTRMTKYKDPKRASRLFFPDELIQYLAWKADGPES